MQRSVIRVISDGCTSIQEVTGLPSHSIIMMMIFLLITDQLRHHHLTLQRSHLFKKKKLWLSWYLTPEGTLIPNEKEVTDNIISWGAKDGDDDHQSLINRTGSSRCSKRESSKNESRYLCDTQITLRSRKRRENRIKIKITTSSRERKMMMEKPRRKKLV